MPQKAVAEASACVSTCDETRDVRHDERALLIDTNDTQVGNKSGKRVVGDLRPGRGYASNERGFSDIRKADQPNVCKKLEFEA